MLLCNEYVVNLSSWETEQISVKHVRENKTWLKKIQPAQSPQQKQPEKGITPDIFDDYFEQVQVSTVCKIVLFVEALMYSQSY